MYSGIVPNYLLMWIEGAIGLRVAEDEPVYTQLLLRIHSQGSYLVSLHTH